MRYDFFVDIDQHKDRQLSRVKKRTFVELGRNLT